MTFSAQEKAARSRAVPPPEAMRTSRVEGLAPGVTDPLRSLPASPPDRVIKLHPTAWSEKWPERPEYPMDVGVRRISEQDQMNARIEATRAADRAHPDDRRASQEWLDTYNQAVMHGCIAHALCRHDNRHEPLFKMQTEVLPSRLTTAGVERLFDELELITVIEGPTRPEATAEELYDLGNDLVSGEFWQDMPMARARHIRRLLAFAIELAEEPIVQITPND